ncbi:unnamed protein product [Adineta steineri]|uniref:Uncharacterized protein n=1 Tax=Adineta steineri TaxID=433720 RepID=A0A814FY89_9BILA|nr:unnamed protein product [Adineta steineri]CAF4065886.1 unnamed protein product [Adineta steineri]
MQDTNSIVRIQACKALGQIGEKAATNDVIAALMTAMQDTNSIVRSQACKALGQIGEKAATKEVIAALMTALRDSDDGVIFEACVAVGEMGEKAATKEVIAALETELIDADWNFKIKVYEVLGRMGEKVATSDVTVALVNMLGDANDWIRQKAYEALCRVIEKEITNDIIVLLADALKNTIARRRACEALSRIGGKAATINVINGLLCIDDDDAYRGLGKILISAPSLCQIDSNTVLKLFDFWSRREWDVRDIPIEKIMEAYKRTKIAKWCPIIALHSFRTACGVTIVGQKVVVYGNSNPIAFEMPSCKLSDDLADVFTNQSGLASYPRTSSRNAVLPFKSLFSCVLC